MRATRSGRRLAHGLFLLSGAAGLGYQLVWAQMLAQRIGHEMPAVLAVVTAFLGGMALGAWILDGPISRSPSPGRWYAALEGAIGLAGLSATALLPFTADQALRWIGLEPSFARHWAVAFGVPFVVLLPATFALGATLPAMERWVARMAADPRCVGGLYAANTLGAVVGTLLCAFALMPRLGLTLTAASLAAVNLLAAVLAFALVRRMDRNRPGADALPPAEPAAPAPSFARPVLSPALAARMLATGVLGIGYEVIGVRVLSQVLENTVYTFALVLAVYLLGTSAGAALYQRFGRGREPARLASDLLGALAVACLLSLAILKLAPALRAALVNALGGHAAAALLAEFGVAAAVFTLPTMVMGATFSTLVQGARQPHGGVGRAAALNTLGGAVGSALFGGALLPWLGSRWTLAVLALGYLTLMPRWTQRRWLYPAGAALLALLPPYDLRLITVPPGGRVLAYREGVMASVAVVEDATGARVLRVNNRFQMGGTAAAAAEYRQAQLPLLLHPDPREALFLGTGTGITLGAATLHPQLRTCGVELVPEVAALMPWFEPHNFAPLQKPNVRLLVADARRVVSVRGSASRPGRTAEGGWYDVIVADLFHPARDGAGALYTVEQFQQMAAALRPGGLCCQWLPLHQLDEATLRCIVRSFLHVFPAAQAWLLHWNVDVPVIGLVGGHAPLAFGPAWLEQRTWPPELAAQLKQLVLADSVRLFGQLLAGAGQLRAFAGDAPLATDDHPRVTFDAPWFAYDPAASAHGRLARVLAWPLPDPALELRLDTTPAAGRLARRVRPYLAARNVFLAGRIADAEGRAGEAVDAYVASARLSEDFTAGYAECLTRASVLAAAQPVAARTLLERLVAARPERPVAQQLLERLFPSP